MAKARKTTAERVAEHEARAADALRALQVARTDAGRIAAARALESAACQIRRALAGRKGGQ